MSPTSGLFDGCSVEVLKVVVEVPAFPAVEMLGGEEGEQE